jgi:hypothetical protein
VEEPTTADEPEMSSRISCDLDYRTMCSWIEDDSNPNPQSGAQATTSTASLAITIVEGNVQYGLSPEHYPASYQQCIQYTLADFERTVGTETGTVNGQPTLLLRQDNDSMAWLSSSVEP